MRPAEPFQVSTRFHRSNKWQFLAPAQLWPVL
jgi:hypothetical protein